MLKELLDNLVEEYWTNKSTREVDGWPGLYRTFFYNDCGKISISHKSKSIRKSALRKEIWNRLKDPGWGYLKHLRLQRHLLQCDLKAPFKQRHLLSASEVSYLYYEHTGE